MKKKDVNNFVFNVDEEKVEDLFVMCVFALPLSLSPVRFDVRSYYYYYYRYTFIINCYLRIVLLVTIVRGAPCPLLCSVCCSRAFQSSCNEMIDFGRVCVIGLLLYWGLLCNIVVVLRTVRRKSIVALKFGFA